MTAARDIALCVLGSFVIAGFVFGTCWLWLAIIGAFFGTGR